MACCHTPLRLAARFMACYDTPLQLAFAAGYLACAKYAAAALAIHGEGGRVAAVGEVQTRLFGPHYRAFGAFSPLGRNLMPLICPMFFRLRLGGGGIVSPVRGAIARRPR